MNDRSKSFLFSTEVYTFTTERKKIHFDKKGLKNKLSFRGNSIIPTPLYNLFFDPSERIKNQKKKK
jgi:hypothetical protein